MWSSSAVVGFGHHSDAGVALPPEIPCCHPQLLGGDLSGLRGMHVAVPGVALYSNEGAKGMGSGRGQRVTCAGEDRGQEMPGDAACMAWKHAGSDGTWASQLFQALHFLY